MSVRSLREVSIRGRSITLPEERPLLAAVFATHGLLDGFVTGLVMALSGANTMESNQLLREVTRWFYLEVLLNDPPLGNHFITNAEAYLGLFVLILKALVVGGLCLLAYAAIPNSRLYRGWLLAVAVVGGVVVLNNLHGLAIA